MMDIRTEHKFKVTYFKGHGKYYSDGHFYGRFEFMSDAVAYCREIMDDADQQAPGLNSNGSGFIWVIDSEDHPNGYPCMLMPSHMLAALDAARKASVAK